MRRSAAELDVPGVGVALIDHGKIVYEGGVGVRQMGKPARVDAHTLFMIASNTRSMSTLLLVELVDEGKLRWDEPVIEAYPPLRLGQRGDHAQSASTRGLRRPFHRCVGLSQITQRLP